MDKFLVKRAGEEKSGGSSTSKRQRVSDTATPVRRVTLAEQQQNLSVGRPRVPQATAEHEEVEGEISSARNSQQAIVAGETERTIPCPIYGVVAFPSSIMDIINTPEFQRLGRLSVSG